MHLTGEDVGADRSVGGCLCILWEEKAWVQTNVYEDACANLMGGGVFDRELSLDVSLFGLCYLWHVLQEDE